MQCENAYIDEKRPYILCRKAPQPAGTSLKGQAHSLCGFQRFCPNVRGCVMLPGWEKCRMRDENKPQTREEDAEPQTEKKTGAGKAKAKRDAAGV